MDVDREAGKPASFEGIRRIGRCVGFALRNGRAVQARRLAESVRSTLALANMEIANLGPRDPSYSGRVREFDLPLPTEDEADSCARAVRAYTRAQVRARQAVQLLGSYEAKAGTQRSYGGRA